MNNVTLGKYLPLDSFVHKLDPRIKICIMVVLMVAVFLPCGFWGHAIVGGFLLIALLASKISVKYVYKSFKPIIFTMLFLLVINVLVIRTGDVLIDLGLARVIHYPNQNLTVSVGTIEYKSPEVVSGNVQYSYAADIWSLTCTIYAM